MPVGNIMPYARCMLMAVLAVSLISCAASAPPPPTSVAASSSSEYRIGPGDMLDVFVWRNPELSVSIPVRPDGRISTPLIEDLPATEKTPTQLARDIESALKNYVQQPVGTVMVTSFVGPYSRQIRVIGEATNPQALPYSDNMSLLDVMIGVGGLTKFAAGNRAVVVRKVDGGTQEFGVRIDRLLKDGDVSANVPMLPGDVLIIPQSFF
jgi:putative polysaccharide export protein, PEP-CTERM sytem-associated